MLVYYFDTLMRVTLMSRKRSVLIKIYIGLERKSCPIENNIYLTNKNNICIEKYMFDSTKTPCNDFLGRERNSPV